MIAIGAGFLILTPLLLTVLHVGKIGLLVRSLPGSRTNALTVILGVLIMPGILLFGMVRDRIAIEEAMNYAISPNPEELQNPPDRDRVERVLQAVHLQSRGIQYPIISPIYRSVVLRGMTIPDSTYSRLQESFGVEEPEAFEPEMGFWSVRERGPNQSRRVSRMEALAELNSIGFQESGNGTLSIEFEVSNPTSGFRTEYRTTFTIPTGTWVSGAELLINGEWKPADFRERRSAEWIYRMIASERIRDPLLVTLQSPNELQVEVFPVDTDKPRRFRVHLQSITGRVSGISIENYSWTPTTKSPSFLTVGHNLLVSPTVELPYQKLSPEYHLFLDRSSFGSRYKSFERELRKTLSEIPQGAHLQWWLIHDGITALPELPAIHDPSIIQSLSQYNIPKERSGGVTIDLLQLAVLHHWRTDLLNGEVPDTYPVIVPIGLKEEDSVSPSTLRFIDPMIGAVPGWILSKDSDLPASDQEAYIFRRDGRIGVVPRDPKDNSSRWAFLFPTSGPIEYLNQARDFALLGEENIATVDNPPAGFLIQMKDALSRYNPAQHEADRAEMISESKSASVLIPDTALIVLETSAQEKFLLELEKLGTEGHSGLSFSETPEPSLIIIGGFGIWLLCQRGRRNQTKDPRK